MSYTEFANKMLLALYRESGGDRAVQVPIATLGNRLGIRLEKPFWLRDLKEEWASLNLASFPEDGSGDRRSVSITLHGVRQAEALPSDLLPNLQGDQEIGGSQFTEASASDLISPLGPNDVVLHPVPQSVQIGDFVEAEIVPASDRVVRFDHNNPYFVEISAGISDVREAVRATNGLDTGSEDRERILAALDAAQFLWKSVQIKVIDLKVGILLALEDATKFLAATAKAVAAALLVDTFKAFVKNHASVDLDNF